MTESIHFTLNAKAVAVNTDGDRELLWVLRTDLGIVGPKFGCGEGICGACTVLMNNEPIRACQTKVREVAGASIVTIEGLEKDGVLHPLQEAFIEHDALQCGFCTSGMILTAHGFLTHMPNPTREQTIEAMNENLCRCGAHKRIVEAIQDAAATIKGGQSS